MPIIVILDIDLKVLRLLVVVNIHASFQAMSSPEV